jgi:hypothetical protein
LHEYGQDERADAVCGCNEKSGDGCCEDEKSHCEVKRIAEKGAFLYQWSELLADSAMLIGLNGYYDPGHEQVLVRYRYSKPQA